MPTLPRELIQHRAHPHEARANARAFRASRGSASARQRRGPSSQTNHAGVARRAGSRRDARPAPAAPPPVSRMAHSNPASDAVPADRPSVPLGTALVGRWKSLRTILAGRDAQPLRSRPLPARCRHAGNATRRRQPSRARDLRRAHLRHQTIRSDRPGAHQALQLARLERRRVVLYHAPSPSPPAFRSPRQDHPSGDATTILTQGGSLRRDLERHYSLYSS
jgi:hypothetical protein